METSRDKIIIQTSIIGIVVNVLLAGFKAGVGLLAHSIAIVMDAVNNLSDALSSIITIIGTKLASKKPDKQHPMGHGRIEYFSTMIIALLVSYAGITALIESVKKILSPEEPDYSIVSVAIIVVAVIVKIILGRYFVAKGEAVNAETLTASGKDALLDSVISAATVVAAIVYIVFHISLEAWLSVIISIYIIKSGIEMIQKTISELLGERVDTELARQVKKAMNSVEGVRGSYDLIMNNYGPDRYIASAHIEVPLDMTVETLDQIIRKIESKVLQETGVIMAGISVYAVDTRDEETKDMQIAILKRVADHPYIRQMHAFHLDKEKKEVRFDAVIDFDAGDTQAVVDEFVGDLKTQYPEYSFSIYPDLDISD